MEKQFLFENETVLLTSNDNTVTLTNRRIMQSISSIGEAYVVSVHLENISSIQIHYRSRPLFLVLGALVAIGGLVLGQRQQEFMAGGIAIGALLVLLYFVTRRHLIAISSNGGAKIHIHTKGMKRDAVLDFMNRIETAKNLIN